MQLSIQFLSRIYESPGCVHTTPKIGSVSTLQATVGVFLQNNYMVSRADKKDVYTNT